MGYLDTLACSLPPTSARRDRHDSLFDIRNFIGGFAAQLKSLDVNADVLEPDILPLLTSLVVLELTSELSSGKNRTSDLANALPHRLPLFFTHPRTWPEADLFATRGPGAPEVDEIAVSFHRKCCPPEMFTLPGRLAKAAARAGVKWRLVEEDSDEDAYSDSSFFCCEVDALRKDLTSAWYRRIFFTFCSCKYAFLPCSLASHVWLSKGSEDEVGEAPPPLRERDRPQLLPDQDFPFPPVLAQSRKKENRTRLPSARSEDLA